MGTQTYKVLLKNLGQNKWRIRSVYLDILISESHLQQYSVHNHTV